MTKFVKHVRARQSPGRPKIGSIAWPAPRWAAGRSLPAGGAWRDADAEALHAFRIQGKQVRYAMEIFVGAFDEAFREVFIRWSRAARQAGSDQRSRHRAKVPGPVARLRRILLATAALEAGLEAEGATLRVSREEFLAWWTVERQADLSNRFAPTSIRTSRTAESRSLLPQSRGFTGEATACRNRPPLSYQPCCVKRHQVRSSRNPTQRPPCTSSEAIIRRCGQRLVLVIESQPPLREMLADRPPPNRPPGVSRRLPAGVKYSSCG